MEARHCAKFDGAAGDADERIQGVPAMGGTEWVHLEVKEIEGRCTVDQRR